MNELRLSVVLCLAAVTLACPQATARADAGDVDAGADAGGEFTFDAGEVDAGEPVDAGPPPELRVRRVLPPRGPAGGGTSVVLEGTGFIRDFATSGPAAKRLTSIRFGSNQVVDFQVIDDGLIELRAPAGVVGNASVTVQNPLGRVVCNGCFAYYDELVVSGFTPRQGPVTGGTEVTFTGQGFTADTQVLFGESASPRITLVSPTQLKAVTPANVGTALVVDVNVYDKTGASSLRRAFTYVPTPRITSLSPLTGPLAGGTTVTLRGQGFAGATQVRFGAQAATSFTVVSATELTAVSPAGTAAGAVDLTVTTPIGSWTTRGGFTYADPSGPLQVFGVVPHVLVPGDVVTVTGQGFGVATTVTLAGRPAAVQQVSPTALTVLVPERQGAARVGDAVVVDGVDTRTRAGGVTWRAQLRSLAPDAGTTAGGTAVTGQGSALPPQAEVSVGAFAATQVAVAGEAQVSFTTPRGSSGPASTVVLREVGDPENEAVLQDGFLYEAPLAIGRVQPDRGAIAGNTLVTVRGAGFGDATVVFFGADRAKDLKVIDAHTLTCRTPKGTVGTVDVRVQRLTQTDTLPGGFSYFDPRSISGGLSGGPLVGTLNVTVLDSTQGNYGAPISGVTVMLGLEPSTPFQGETDARGQVTFSDPSLVKAQVVTAFKEGFELVTVTEVNAENLTVFMARTGGGEPSSGQPPPPPPPSQISGRVTGFKSPRPLMSGETLEARVFVAQTSLFASAPFRGAPTRRGETWRLQQDGQSYLVLTGAGLRAVYAVLGILGDNDDFRPIAMGVKRGISASPESPALNQDIVLDMQLDLTVPITIDGALTFPSSNPLGGGRTPGLNRVYAWLDLGAEGFIPNALNWAAGTSGESAVSGTGTSLSFPFFPQLDGSNFIFMSETEGPQVYPVSYYFRRQPGPMAPGVTIGPLLPGPQLREPLGVFNGRISWTLEGSAVPNLHNVQIVKQTLAGLTVLWNMVLPGTETQVVLPAPAVQALRTAEAGNQLFVLIYSSRAPKFSYNQWTYDTLSGVSWSSFTIAVSPAFSP